MNTKMTTRRLDLPSVADVDRSIALLEKAKAHLEEYKMHTAICLKEQDLSKYMGCVISLNEKA